MIYRKLCTEKVLNFCFSHLFLPQGLWLFVINSIQISSEGLMVFIVFQPVTTWFWDVWEWLWLRAIISSQCLRAAFACDLGDLKWFACGGALKRETILIGSYRVGAVHGFWKWSDLAAILVLFTVRCLAQANIPLFSVCFLFPWLSHSCLLQSRWNSLGFSSLVLCHLPLLLKFSPGCWALNH